MTKRLFVCCLCFLLLTTYSIADADTQSYLLRSKFTKGKVQRMKTVTDFTVSAPETLEDPVMIYQSVEVQKITVQKVNKDGSAQLSALTESFKYKDDDQEASLPKSKLPSMTFTLDTLGKRSDLAEKNALEQDFTTFREFSQPGIDWPEKPVKVGESWAIKEKSPMHPSKEATVTYTLVGVEPFGSEQAFKIKLEFTAPIDTTGDAGKNRASKSDEPPMKGDFVGSSIMLVRVSNGELIRNDLDATMTVDAKLEDLDDPEIPAELQTMKIVAKVKVQQYPLPITTVR